ncbi:MAG: ABC transporter permease [Clostridia bacterium]|nr:ABC transporter permease [Clostridia bacterium]
MLAVFKREIKAYFYSPVAYVLIGLFMLVSSIIFVYNLRYQIGDFNNNLESVKITFIFIIPILTMRLLAEDRKNGTEVLLVTSPSSLSGIVVGKYLAALFVFLVMTALTFIYPAVLAIFGAPITAKLIGAYVGFILLGAALVSIGIFASSLTENQIIAAVVSFISILVMLFVDSVGSIIGGNVAKVITWISLFSRQQDFTNGILNLSPIVYFLSFTVVFIFLTIRVVEKRRWSQG